MQYDELKVGMKLKADGGFTCLNRGEISTVEFDADGYFIRCGGPRCSKKRVERHYLKAQCDDDNNLIGLELMGKTA